MAMNSLIRNVQDRFEVSNRKTELQSRGTVQIYVDGPREIRAA